MKLYGTNTTPKPIWQTFPKQAPCIVQEWMLSIAQSLLGKGSESVVCFLSWLNCEQETKRLWVETETFDALMLAKGEPGMLRSSCQCFLNLFWFGKHAEDPEMRLLFIQTDLLALLLIRE